MLQKCSHSHGIFIIKIEGLTNRLQFDRSYLSFPIPSTFSRCRRVVSCNGIQARVPAYQVFREFVKYFPRRGVTRSHDPRLRIERPYHLPPMNSNPTTPDPVILFKLLVQLQGPTAINAQGPTAVLQHISPQSIRASPLAVSPSLHCDGY